MQKSYKPHQEGIELKKKHGQHFLQDTTYVMPMIDAVHIDPTISVIEIGCGAGILTGEILQTSCKQLKVFEIDPEWADFVIEKFENNPRLQMNLLNILELDWSTLSVDAPLVLLANLPYQITFPIIYKLLAARHLFNEGVVMVQEEVAQKIVQQSGRGYGFHSLYLQRYFDWKLLNKIPPTAFFPAPKVNSRLLYFKPKKEVITISEEEGFWKFIKFCFLQPRRTLRNNLAQTHYKIERLTEDTLNLRAQQLSMGQFLEIWNLLIDNK